MAWSNKTVAVTGAGGFIASHLCEKLVDLGANVRPLVRYNSGNRWGWLDHSPVRDQMDVRMGDLCDFDSVRQVLRGVDVVFHLGALIAIPYSYVAPRSYVATNVEGTLNVLTAARDEGVSRVVHTSTSECYGTARQVPINESHPLQGQSPYSATKIAADKLAESFYLSFDLPVSTIRPFNTYGPRQSARAVIPTIITQVLTGDEVRLGSLSPTRDLNFVADTVRGFLAVGESDKAVGRTINIGSGREISIGDLAAMIFSLMDRPVDIVTDEQRVRPAGSEVDRLLADNSLAEELLGWKPEVSLRDGLAQTIEWLREWLPLYRGQQYVV